MKAKIRMSRVLKWMTGLLFLLVVSGFLSVEAEAKMRPKLMALNMKKSTTIKEDLDGDGIKDKIVFEIKNNGESFYVFTLYINDEKYGLWTGEFYGTAMMLITDMDDGDSCKELWIADEWQAGLEVSRVFSVGESYFSTLYNCENREGDFFIPRIITDSGEHIVSKGDGYISYETEYYTEGLGNYYYDVTLRLLEDGFKLVGDKKTQKITAFWKKDRPYKLTKGLKVYSEFKGKKTKFNLKKGDVFYLYEVRFTKKKRDEYGYWYFYEPWAFIKTKRGKSGWIKVPKGDFYRSPEGYKYEWG